MCNSRLKKKTLGQLEKFKYDLYKGNSIVMFNCLNLITVYWLPKRMLVLM